MILFAVVAPDAGEAVFKIATIDEFVHHLGNDRAQEPIAFLVAFLVLAEERIKVPKQALPKRRGLRLSRAVCRTGHAQMLHAITSIAILSLSFRYGNSPRLRLRIPTLIFTIKK